MGDFFIGEIRNFAFGSLPGGAAPQGWLPCDGRSLAINQNQALYSLLGTAFGGTSTTFNLPDLRGRVAISQGVTAQGKIYNRGTAGGAENVALTAEQLPQHSHSFQGRSEEGTLPLITGNIVSASGANPPTVPTAQALYAAPAAPMVALNPASLSMTGSATGHPNMQPYLVNNFCISTTGLYPPRP